LSDRTTDIAGLSFEDAMRELEAIVGRLEQGGATLDESLGAFEKGVALLRVLHGRLDEVEKRVEVLVRDAAGVLRVRAVGDADK
jgi:exodeoxyribonuclease VII small subunit